MARQVQDAGQEGAEVTGEGLVTCGIRVVGHCRPR